MKEWLEFAAVWLILKMIGALPRGVARGLAAFVTSVLFSLQPRLKKTAEFNLRLAFPDWTDTQRTEVTRKMVRNLGWMAAEFARFPRLTKESIEELVILDGHENFLEGQRRGNGVLYLTGHIGAWELSSFAHALYGYPLHYMARPLDNKRLDALVNQYRCASGNRPIFKNESARVMLKILKDSGTVGILGRSKHDAGGRRLRRFFRQIRMHHYWYCPRSTAHRRRRCAWVCVLGRVHSKISIALRASRGIDSHRRLRNATYFENTQRFTKVIEETIRKYPDQWVWVHKRWKTRPKGEPALYDF